MTARAHVEFDAVNFGIRLAVQRTRSAEASEVLVWEQPVIRLVTEASMPADDAWLRLPEEDARAIYAALAEHFGHAGHDVRALRKDYDDERARVDRLIDYATTPPIIVRGDVND